jgi:hypothetical protein
MTSDSCRARSQVSSLLHCSGSCALQRTKILPLAFASHSGVPRFASVMSFSAHRWASFALCHVVFIDSCLNNDVTRFRSNAFRCAECRLSVLYLINPPAMFATKVLWAV